MERGTPTSARRTPSGLLRIKLQCAVADWNTSEGWKWDRFVGWVGVSGTDPLVGSRREFQGIPSLAASERHARDRGHGRTPRRSPPPYRLVQRRVRRRRVGPPLPQSTLSLQ